MNKQIEVLLKKENVVSVGRGKKKVKEKDESSKL